VANHPSSEKRNRQRIKRTLRNRSVTSSVRTVVKKVRTAVAAKDNAVAKQTLLTAISTIAKAATKGVLHKKTASRRIGRLTRAVHKLTAVQK
jgi:small subunit ribosomal protein S20